jgi:thiamine pyrophosphate-dependent acetolactate synthase large subunit-like protein
MTNLEKLERPNDVENTRSNTLWGSDVFAEMMRRIGLKYVALNPGASYRGLHDSIVNSLGNVDPQMILCLHEEHAVALAQGYAKVTGEPMGAILHSNVGLLHGAMGIFNCWVDRVPMIVFGATGPVDAAKRRPWIDWIHTAQDQGGLIRDFIKWDDQPGSVLASIESMLRASQIARTAPQGPTYICLDAALQEQRLDEMPALPDNSRFQPPAPAVPSPAAIAEALKLLKGAKSAIMLVGRVSRDPLHWRRRVALAEALNVKVMTDLKNASGFPTDHKLYCGKPGFALSTDASAALAEADVVLSLDWIDLGGTTRMAYGKKGVTGKIIQASIDHNLHSGASMEHHILPVIDLFLAADPDATVEAMCAALGIQDSALPKLEEQGAAPLATKALDLDAIDIPGFGSALGEALVGEKICLVRVPLGWDGGMWHFRHPLDYLGTDGGGGVGSGPGMTVGASLGLRGTDRLPVALLGDGDFMMASSALWTATHYRLPMLIVICNNQSFYNDEVHQERVAKVRNRPVENKWIGQRFNDPEIDLAAIARAQGAEGIGPVRTPKELAKAVKEGLAHAKQGKVCVIDARVLPGYTPAMANSLVRQE